MITHCNLSGNDRFLLSNLETARGFVVEDSLLLWEGVRKPAITDWSNYTGSQESRGRASVRMKHASSDFISLSSGRFSSRSLPLPSSSHPLQKKKCTLGILRHRNSPPPTQTSTAIEQQHAEIPQDRALILQAPVCL